MKTVVYQAFVGARAPWIERCMAGVREWAALRGFEYRDDSERVFDDLPGWFREKAAGSMTLQTDLARMQLARRHLDEGFERAVWVDADVVVFDPARFAIRLTERFAFCREVWADLDEGGAPRWLVQTYAAVTVFTKGERFLDVLMYLQQEVMRAREAPLDPNALSTNLLTVLRRQMPFPLLTSVAQVSPLLAGALLEGRDGILDDYMQRHGHPVRAANLCSSFSGRTYSGVAMSDAVFDAVIERLVASRGEVLNRRLPAAAGAAGTMRAG